MKWEVVFEDEPNAGVQGAAKMEESAVAGAAAAAVAVAAGGGEEAGKAKGKDLTAAKNEIFGYLSSDEEDEASSARQVRKNNVFFHCCRAAIGLCLVFSS